MKQLILVVGYLLFTNNAFAWEESSKIYEYRNGFPSISPSYEVRDNGNGGAKIYEYRNGFPSISPSYEVRDNGNGGAKIYEYNNGFRRLSPSYEVR